MYKSMPKVDEQVLDQYPFIKNYIKLLEKAFTFGAENIASIEELDKYFIGEYGWKGRTIQEILEEDDWYKDSYNEYKKMIELDYNITFREVDHSDELTSEMLKSLNDGVNFIVKGEY